MSTLTYYFTGNQFRMVVLDVQICRLVRHFFLRFTKEGVTHQFLTSISSYLSTNIWLYDHEDQSCPAISSSIHCGQYVCPLLHVLILCSGSNGSNHTPLPLVETLHYRTSIGSICNWNHLRNDRPMPTNGISIRMVIFWFNSTTIFLLDVLQLLSENIYQNKFGKWFDRTATHQKPIGYTNWTFKCLFVLQ